MTVRELGSEMKAQPSVEAEKDGWDQRQLKRLEAEGLWKILGKDEDENIKKPKHMSADDLSGGFGLDRDDRCLLSY
ncbi:Nucleolar protein 14 [Myotis brandtii]|uniref:Nucleolar protein 14 n=1 Tax=Myotis brandtii TaxID=109478 RepID=S7Q880_MYOBR|nr:Nucleolar protein 14 [Myotis brandtii]